VETTARQSLELRAAQLVTLENLSKTSLPPSNWPHSHGPEPDWLNAVNAGELVELDCRHPDHAGHIQFLFNSLNSIANLVVPPVMPRKGSVLKGGSLLPASSRRSKLPSSGTLSSGRSFPERTSAAKAV
jgi:hypothetical protein